MPSFDTFMQFGRTAIQRNFGRTVTRHVRGNTTVDGTSVENAVFTETRSKRDEALGLDNVRYGQLHLAESVELTTTDAWTIDGELWLTDSVGPTNGGFRTVYLRKREEIRRRPNANPFAS